MMVKEIEYEENEKEKMKEMWRVMEKKGRIVIVVKKRRGVWESLENKNLGRGRKYRRKKIEKIMREENLKVRKVRNEINFKKERRRWMMRK